MKRTIFAALAMTAFAMTAFAASAQAQNQAKEQTLKCMGLDNQDIVVVKMDAIDSKEIGKIGDISIRLSSDSVNGVLGLTTVQGKVIMSAISNGTAVTLSKNNGSLATSVTCFIVEE